MQTTVIFKADKKQKEAAQKAAKEMGIPFSALMNAYLRDFVESKEVTLTQRGIKMSQTRHVDEMFKKALDRKRPR